MAKSTNTMSTGTKAPENGDPFRGAGTHIQHSIADITPILIATAIKISNVDAGRQRLVELINAAFKAKFGAAVAAFKRKASQTKAKLERIANEQQVIADELLETAAWIPASQTNHGRTDRDHVETPFGQWQAPHRIEAVLILCLIPFAAAASMMTAHANLAGTGLPVFIENPALAWTMAALAPMSGFAIKTMWSHLRSEALRKMFTYGLNMLALGFIILWILLFADQFHGLSTGSVASGLFDEPSPWDGAKETAFVAVTLATEILITAVLAHRLDKIATQYAPNYWLENPEHRSLTQRLRTLDADHKQLTDDLGAIEGELDALQGSLELQVQLATLAYEGRRAVQAESIL